MTKQWTEKEVVTLGKLRRRGTSYRTIGELLGRSTSSCQQKAFHLGIAKPHRKEQPTQEQDKQETTGEVRKVTLTRAQINICNTLGLTPRQYAKQMVMLEEEHAEKQQRRKPMPKRKNTKMTKRKNTKWTEELDAQLVSLRELGVRPRDIATTMKLPRSVIYSRSATLGVTKTSAQLEMDLQVTPATEPTKQVAPATEPTKQVAPATKTEFRESPKTQPKPTWWSAMMWWRN